MHSDRRWSHPRPSTNHPAESALNGTVFADGPVFYTPRGCTWPVARGRLRDTMAPWFFITRCHLPCRNPSIPDELAYSGDVDKTTVA